MKLYLVQHGAATAADVDAQRPLTAAGESEVRRMALALRSAGISVARVIHSGKLRAQQTAAILAADIAPGGPLESSAALAPNDDPAGFDIDDGSGDTMLVGHLPFMSRMVAHLVCGDADRALLAYRPGSIVCLESADAGGWQINWMLRPELLAPASG